MLTHWSYVFVAPTHRHINTNTWQKRILAEWNVTWYAINLIWSHYHTETTIGIHRGGPTKHSRHSYEYCEIKSLHKSNIISDDCHYDDDNDDDNCAIDDASNVTNIANGYANDYANNNNNHYHNSTANNANNHDNSNNYYNHNKIMIMTPIMTTIMMMMTMMMRRRRRRGRRRRTTTTTTGVVKTTIG